MEKNKVEYVTKKLDDNSYKVPRKTDKCFVMTEKKMKEHQRI